MESAVSRTLNMNRYFNECGTPACALGEAATIPTLREAGLSRGKHSVGGEDEVFGLTDHQDDRLFGFGTIVWQRSNVTPQEWAAEARKVLGEHGYSMDAKPDTFAAFMAKVQEPVAVTA
jgi:hypothetical protein